MNLAYLNEAQRAAVTETEGPLLILAGAGSGKTTVVVNKIAYLLEQGLAKPWNILAITFTNKAANEMKSRVEALLGEAAQGMQIGTFHSSCMRFLRRDADKLGYGSDFVIYDTADSQTLMRQILRDLNIDEKKLTHRAALSEISSAKNELLEPEVYADMHEGDFRKSQIAGVYALYQKRLFQANALDFDDLILQAVKLFTLNPEVLAHYQQKFRYIFVDEYQDTNNAQYMLASLLSGGHKNICVVGDDDQSIYKFRGANINNILDFEKEFPGAKLIKLEQNYRSTQTILDAANGVIRNNAGRKRKTLWTENGAGEKIDLYRGENEYAESFFVADKINFLVKSGQARFNDFAVLYRTNAQSRVIEETFIKNAVAYRVLAGLRFYDRKEIKDMTAYLRLAVNPADNVSLARIVNEPKRNIGAATLEKIAAAAAGAGLSMYETMQNAYKMEEIKALAPKVQVFVDVMEAIRAKMGGAALAELMEFILGESGYADMLRAENKIENQTRMENLQEFIASAQGFEASEEDATLARFLENVALVSDVDNYDAEQDAVTLMTIHSAKGLEFPYVFVAGMEEGLFPSERARADEDEIEEERRLCYVAITRAKKNLSLSYARRRNMYGASRYGLPSRFLEEIDVSLLNDVTPEAASVSSVSPAAARGANGRSVFAENYATNRQIEQLLASGGPRGFDVRSGGAPSFDFAAGDAVTHKKFGKGKVLSVLPVGSDVKLEILFDGAGVKNLMASFAKLRKA